MPMPSRMKTIIPALASLLLTLLPGATFGLDEPKPAGSPRPRTATEAWAHPDLKVTRGLALWLDAGRLDAARRAHGRPEVRDGTKVDVWYDASGHGHDPAQAREQAQPTYEGGALRFDGEASHLEWAG